MAELSARGYVSNPEAKITRGGKPYSTFTLGVKQKSNDRDGQEVVTWGNYRVTDWNNASPPPNKAFVTLKGYLTVREYQTQDGRKGQSLDVKATELEVAPPRGTPDTDTGNGDPFGDLPF